MSSPIFWILIVILLLFGRTFHAVYRIFNNFLNKKALETHKLLLIVCKCRTSLNQTFEEIKDWNQVYFVWNWMYFLRINLDEISSASSQWCNFAFIGCKIVKYNFLFFSQKYFSYFYIFWWHHLNDFHFCLIKIAHIVENKLFYRINERDVSILWSKDSKILMKNGILNKTCCKKWLSNFKLPW